MRIAGFLPTPRVLPRPRCSLILRCVTCALRLLGNIEIGHLGRFLVSSKYRRKRVSSPADAIPFREALPDYL
jgi:hypothetical protein